MYYALINGLVDDALWDACPSVNEVLLQASDVMNKYLVHMFLHPKSCSQMGLGLDCLVVATDLTRWILVFHAVAAELSYERSVRVHSSIAAF